MLVEIFVATMVMAIFVVWGLYCSFRAIEEKKDELMPGYKTLIVLGSGGHTTEMLTIVKELNFVFRRRVYIAAVSDKFSIRKVKKMEKHRSRFDEISIAKVNRIRNVKESMMYAFLRLPCVILETLALLLIVKPNIIICNGPGICVPYGILAVFLRKLGFLECKIAYVESVCRTSTLSVSGRIMVYFADAFAVQWPELKTKCETLYPWRKFAFGERLS